MAVQSLKSSLLAGFIVVTAGAAHAADYAPPPPPPPVVQPQVEEVATGWYLRGYVGIGMNAKPDLQYLPAPANVGNGFVFEHNDISDSYFLGGGVGYEWNNWLRFDATVDYRAATRLYASGVFDQITGQGDIYQGYLKSWIFLANAYVDLGTWNCITPFVGVGVGGAYNTLADFVDTGFGVTGRGFGRNSSNWSMAWALHAGLAFDVTKNFKVELAYRYLNYGSVTDTIDCVGGCNADSYKFDKLHSHDIMLGLRWTCCEVAETRYVQQQVYAPPPVYTPPPAYSPPPPAYAPPPLQSRG